MEARANVLKAEGNKCFQRGDYAAAEGLYSQALVAPSILWPKLLHNAR
jgi:hypothetical protein